MAEKMTGQQLADRFGMKRGGHLGFEDVPGVKDAYSALGVGGEQNKGIKDKLDYQALRASDFANYGEDRFVDADYRLRQLGANLRDQTMGKNLVSAEQLRQGNQQLMAQQRSMAASASPANQAAASRGAMMNAARLGAGLSGQQAVAALQERNAAQALLAQAEQARMNAGLNAALDARKTSIGGYNSIMNAPQQPSGLQRLGGAASGAFKLYQLSQGNPAALAGPPAPPSAAGNPYMPGYQ